LAPGGGFDRSFRPPISLRIVDFLRSRTSCSLRDLYEALEETPEHVGECLDRLWLRGLILRTKQASYVFETANKGRGGVFGYTRAFNRYALNDGRDLPSDFVKYEDRYKDGRNLGFESKASKVLTFLKNHSDQAFYSKSIVEELKVKPCDIMANVRRFEKQGLVFVRGYQSHDARRNKWIIDIQNGRPLATIVQMSKEIQKATLLERASTGVALD
jgi:DNA-binding MarR family transcriptional regulator